MKTSNIFSNTPKNSSDELFEEILQTQSFTLERIISVKPSLPKDQWYDQQQNEWVMVLKGAAGLRFADNDNVVVMKPGDYLKIPARLKHRVEWTDPTQETVWLAIHYS